MVFQLACSSMLLLVVCCCGNSTGLAARNSTRLLSFPAVNRELANSDSFLGQREATLPLSRAAALCFCAPGLVPQSSSWLLHELISSSPFLPLGSLDVDARHLLPCLRSFFFQGCSFHLCPLSKKTLRPGNQKSDPEAAALF